MRPFVLTIAGFDPTSGAGLTADIKTFEKLKCYGLAVCTANTIQTENEFYTCDWVKPITIKNQLEKLINQQKIDFVKIGIAQDWNLIFELSDIIFKKNKNVKIVLDPVLNASSGFSFHENTFSDELLQKTYLLTPNLDEINAFYPGKNLIESVNHIASKTNLLLKGGHNKDFLGKDQLYLQNGKTFTFNTKGRYITEKHGSGCVLSAAITAYLALGFPLHKACFRGKKYTEKVLSSNKSLLGYHA